MARKGYDYFEYFAECAKLACDAAHILEETIVHFDYQNLAHRVQVMHELENKADAIKHEMTNHLAKEFIPPIDREDILALSHELDNVVDTLDDIVMRMDMFDIHAIRPEAIQFAQLIIRCCEELHAAAMEFRHFKSSKLLQEKIVMVNTLESEGDHFHSNCVRNLFRSATPERELFIWSALFDDFEDCLDACEHASDAMESVILKNA